MTDPTYCDNLFSGSSFWCEWILQNEINTVKNIKANWFFLNSFPLSLTWEFLTLSWAHKSSENRGCHLLLLLASWETDFQGGHTGLAYTKYEVFTLLRRSYTVLEHKITLIQVTSTPRYMNLFWYMNLFLTNIKTVFVKMEPFSFKDLMNLQFYGEPPNIFKNKMKFITDNIKNRPLNNLQLSLP